MESGSNGRSDRYSTQLTGSSDKRSEHALRSAAMGQAQARSSARSSGDASATIGRSARVRGRVTGEGDLLIEGAVEGDITIGGDVTVSGTLDGDVVTSGAVHIHAGARVRGNVKSDEISLEEGAEFSGQLSADFDLPKELQGSGDASSAGTSGTSGARRR
jgi:cytoskeletal protein CcmA (bactofilin family)